jgi:uncharacterized membrane protein YsdA (DUF1294 family)
MNPSRSRPRNPFAIQLGLAAFALALTLLLTVRWRINPIVAYLLSINGATVLAYAYDKWAASRERVRIPEASLHILAALGGTPAAFVAPLWFRHKTKKQSFRIRFWLIALGQVAVLIAWMWWSGHRGR